jgi:hypothetical protein
MSNEEKNITSQLWNDIEQGKDKTKIANKVYHWLNKDNLGGIYTIDNDTFYFIPVNSFVSIPDYIYNWLKKWGKNKGYRYLDDITERF